MVVFMKILYSSINILFILQKDLASVLGEAESYSPPDSYPPQNYYVILKSVDDAIWAE